MPSFDRPADADIAPSAWVLRYAHLIAPGGRVLDLACGHGRHARYLAARGCRVIAADIDTAALEASVDGDCAAEALSSLLSCSHICYTRSQYEN